MANFSITTHLSIADRSHSFLRIVLDDCGLVDKHVLLGVIPVDESISRLDVEPFDCSADFGGDHFLWFLLLHFFPSLLLV